jgi:hypothetical protein
MREGYSLERGCAFGGPDIGGFGVRGDQTTSTRLSLAVLMSFQGFSRSNTRGRPFKRRPNVLQRRRLAERLSAKS